MAMISHIINRIKRNATYIHNGESIHIHGHAATSPILRSFNIKNIKKIPIANTLKHP